MIQVTMDLQDSTELALFQQLAAIIEHRRTITVPMSGEARGAEYEVSDETQGVTAENPGQDAEPEAPVATIVAPGKAVTLADLEKTAQAAIDRAGLAEVRKVVNEYGKPRLREVDSSLWPEVIEKLANLQPLVAAE